MSFATTANVIPTYAPVWVATHRADCARCGATSLIGQANGDDTVRSCVARNVAAVRALPVLTATVWWTCGACDRDNNAGLLF